MKYLIVIIFSYITLNLLFTSFIYLLNKNVNFPELRLITEYKQEMREVEHVGLIPHNFQFKQEK